MPRILIGVLLILHGLAHSGLAAAPLPKDVTSHPGSFFTHPSRTWLLGRLRLSPAWIRGVGLTLIVLTTIGFVLAGLAALGVPLLAGAVAPLIICSAVLSLVLLAVFWHAWLALGVAIDVAILVLWVGRGL